ncbi:hypothetical protein [Bifidobacterium polysaccharolyticum]|uniref:hypothetical protein n=1 Tax=Bifidobacterium polysaccharolyticum TaxID=2750967 RepID=UPI0021BA7C5A|nr:hypothetical protein [Bifidobacterium polysaccharolyticum]MCT8157553.1 hypothetical protein [Bifidobacterium polysaccharolyticum]
MAKLDAPALVLPSVLPRLTIRSRLIFLLISFSEAAFVPIDVFGISAKVASALLGEVTVKDSTDWP